MATKMIDVVHRGPVGMVTLRRPPANAMNIELLEEMTEVFERLGQDKSLRSVVLTGQGNSFCAGVDLKAVPHYNDADQRRMVVALNRAFFAVYSFPGPVVGAINGHAIAGGLVLALCCDWRIAAKVQFLTGLTEVRVGVPYPVGAMEVVRQELRPDVLRHLVLFAQNITASAAVEAGVFDEMVEPSSLLDRAMEKAGEFAALPQIAFMKTKRQIRSRAYEAIEAAIAGAEPVLNGWLSKETILAATAVLQRA